MKRDEYLKRLRTLLDEQWNTLLDHGCDRSRAYELLYNAVLDTLRK